MVVKWKTLGQTVVVCEVVKSTGSFERLLECDNSCWKKDAHSADQSQRERIESDNEAKVASESSSCRPGGDRLVAGGSLAAMI